MRTRVSLSLVLWMSAAVVLPRVAGAVPVTWSYTGVVQIIEGDAAAVAQISSLGVVVGAPVQGAHRFESDTPNFEPSNPELGRYVAAIDRQSFSVGSIAVDLDLVPSLGRGDILVRGTPPLAGTFTSVAWVQPGAFLERGSVELLLITNDPGAASPGNALWIEPPPLSIFPPFEDGGTVHIYFRGITDAGRFVLYASVTSVVPEPGLAGLALAAMIGLAGPRLW